MPTETQIQTFTLDVGELAKAPSISDVLQMTPNCSKQTIVKLHKLCLDNVRFDGFEQFPDGFFTPDQEISPELQQLKVNYVCIAQEIPLITSMNIHQTRIDIAKENQAKEFEFTFQHRLTEKKVTIEARTIKAENKEKLCQFLFRFWKVKETKKHNQGHSDYSSDESYK